MQANHILDLLSLEFGEEDYAIATTEVDEKRDIWETSIYLMFDEEDDILARVNAALVAEFPDLPVEREVIPDIDWIAKSLEGLTPVRAGRFLVHGPMTAIRSVPMIWPSRLMPVRLSAPAIMARRLAA